MTMARDFEELNSLDGLSDVEIRGLVREHLAAHNALDINDFIIDVENGQVNLAGRVGTSGERLVAERILTDVLGIQNFRNDVFVDPTHRAISPEAADESIADDARRAGLLFGDRPVPLSPEVEEVERPMSADLHGTSDPRVATSEATPWIPPESLTPEGLGDVEERSDDS
jgi:hypothetical protein